MLKEIKRFNPNIFVVFLSGRDDIGTAVNSLKYGAFDYIVKCEQDQEHIERVLRKIKPILDSLEIHSLHKPKRELEEVHVSKPDAAVLAGLVEQVVDVIGAVNGQLLELAATEVM